MNDKQQWAVYLDCGADNGSFTRGTVTLGGSIGEKWKAEAFLHQMADWNKGYDAERFMWEVDEDDLPFGYTFQTYYVARYYGEDVAK